MSRADDMEKAEHIRNDLHDGQRLKVEDPDDHQGLVTGRRRGKTFGIAAELIIDALENPGGQELYVTLTKEHARTLLWDNPDTGIKKLQQKYGLQMRFDNVRAIAFFSNESVLALMGADRNDQIDKVRGRALRNVAVDECGSFSPGRLRHFVYDIVEPTLADYLGSLTLAGTPGPRLGGPFFEATFDRSTFYGEPPSKLQQKCRPYRDRRKKAWRGKKGYAWSMHTFTLEDQVALPHLEDYMNRLKERNMWGDDDRRWVNEWLGLWMLDLSALVYQYKSDYDWKGGGLPPLEDGATWHTVGAWHWHSDGTVGVVVCAYNDINHEVYNLASIEKKDPTLKWLASILLKWEEDYGVRDWVGTRPGKSRGKGIMHELRDQFGLFCHIGDLNDAMDLIVVANNDLASGFVHVVEDSVLKETLLALQWEDPGVAVDSSETSDAVTTAWLYCLRFCNHRGPRSEAPNKGPKPGTTEYLDKQAIEAKRRMQEKQRRMSDGTFDWLESELGEIDGDFKTW